MADGSNCGPVGLNYSVGETVTSQLSTLTSWANGWSGQASSQLASLRSFLDGIGGAGCALTVATGDQGICDGALTFSEWCGGDVTYNPNEWDICGGSGSSDPCNLTVPEAPEDLTIDYGGPDAYRAQFRDVVPTAPDTITFDVVGDVPGSLLDGSEPDVRPLDLSDVDLPTPYAPEAPDNPLEGLGLAVNLTAPRTLALAQPTTPTLAAGAKPALTLTHGSPVAITPVTPNPITVPDVGARPEWTLTAPEFDDPGRPGEAPRNQIAKPMVDTFPIPVYSGPADPPSPSLLSISDVTIRDPALPNFSITMPPLETLPTLEGTIFYSDPGYTDAQLAQLKTEISRVLNGNLIIPDYLWDNIWEKAASQLHRQAVALERQARRAWAKLGWSMPGGIALAGREQAAHDINEQISAKALEQAVQRATMEREDYWKAMQEGTALQQLLVGLYNAQQERALKLAISQVEVLVNVYNAYLAKSQADLTRITAQVQIKELELKGALATLDVDKAKLEAAKLKGELNQLAVQAYVAQWEAVKYAIERWKGQVEAVNTQIKNKELEVTLFSEQIKGWLGEVEAWGKEWDGYVAALKAQETKATIYDVSARAFSERMKGYNIDAEVAKIQVESQVSAENLRLEAQKVDVQRFAAEWQAITSELGALVQKYQVDGSIYATDRDSDKALLMARTETEKLKIETNSQAIQKYGIDRQAEVALMQAETQVLTSQMQALVSQFGNLVQLEGIKVQAAGQDVQRFTAEINAAVSVFQAQAQMLGADAQVFQAKVQHLNQVLQTEGQFAAARVQQNQNLVAEYAEKIKLAIATMEGALKTIEANLNYYRTTEIEGGKLELETEIAQIDATVKVYAAAIEGLKGQASVLGSKAQALSAKASGMGAYAQMIGAKAQLEGEKNTAAQRQIQITAELAKAEGQRLIAEAQIKAAATTAMTELQVQGLQAIGNVYAQMAAGAMSAANVQASISAGVDYNNSSTCTTQYSYSMTE